MAGEIVIGMLGYTCSLSVSFHKHVGSSDVTHKEFQSLKDKTTGMEASSQKCGSSIVFLRTALFQNKIIN